MNRQIVLSPLTLALAVGLVLAVLVIAVLATVMLAGDGEASIPVQAGQSSASPTTPAAAAVASPAIRPTEVTAAEEVPPTPTPAPTVADTPAPPPPPTATSPPEPPAPIAPPPTTPTVVAVSHRLSEAQAAAVIQNTALPSGKTVGSCARGSFHVSREGPGWWKGWALFSNSATDGRLEVLYNEDTAILQVVVVPIGC